MVGLVDSLDICDDSFDFCRFIVLDSVDSVNLVGVWSGLVSYWLCFSRFSVKSSLILVDWLQFGSHFLWFSQGI